MNKLLNDLMQKADAWPETAQQELAAMAREIEAELFAGTYIASPDEIAGIDRGLNDVAEGRFATDADVAALLAKLNKA